MVADANSSYGEGRWHETHMNSYSLVELSLCIFLKRKRRLWKEERPGERDEGERKRKKVSSSPEQSGI
jgi:hypothetical protein